MMMMRSSEFEFWKQTDHHQLCGGHYYPADNNGTADSPQLWKTAKSRLPYDTRKLKATIDYSREDFMEVIRDMPESSYDLSFKDMVDTAEKPQETGHKKERIKLPPMRRNRAICRSQSMESEVFLLKMFVSFGSSKKSPARQRKKALSEFIPRPSSGKQRGARNWWKMMFVSVKDNNRPKIEPSTSDVSSNRTSLLVGSSLPCQRSFNEKKFKSRDCKGCLF